MKKIAYRSKRKKQISKRGVTLVELVIGIAIIVVVFAGTLGALSGGYTTTVNNADQEKASAICASANEIVMTAINDLKITKKDELDDDLSKTDSAIISSVTRKYTNMKYVDPADFYTASDNMCFTIEPDKTSTVSGSTLSTRDVKGVIIRTSVKSAAGRLINESFVPYNHT